MRDRGAGYGMRALSRFALIGLIGGASAACSSDTMRFGDPFSNPFSSSGASGGASAEPGATGSLPEDQAVAPIHSSPIRSQALGAPPAAAPTPLSSRPAPAPQTPRAVATAPATGGPAGWTAQGGTTVTVGQGDTLSQMSTRFGVPAAAILSANGLSSASQVTPGRHIVIPVYHAGGSAAVTPRATPAAPQPRMVLQQGKPAAEPRRVVEKVAEAPKEEPAPKPHPRPGQAMAAPVKPAAVERAAKLNARPAEPAKVAKAEPKPEPKAEAAKPAKPEPKPEPKKVEARHEAKPEVKTAAAKPAPKLEPKVVAKAEPKPEPKRIPEKPVEKVAKIEPRKPVEKAPEAPKPVARAELPKPEPKAEAAKPAKPEPKVVAKVEPKPEPKVEAAKPVKPPAEKPVAEKPAEPAPAPAPAEETSAFRWPARGRVIAGYGSSGNEGINIALPEGTPVKAAEEGTVAYAGSDVKGYGKLVLVRHANGYVSAYAHNGEIDVRPGDKVKRGQVIAKSGASGNVTSPQLHFEIRKGATPVDPIPRLASN
ncbi:M23 family metallopeptidase [Methylobacterium nodulans]|uniref:Peptidase M23 n=1 Tax=Methylobacterium nodulans (strain LMG 21967 / CNCM I-2342 / ORS 2060) TaxID=460265 RepID=B8IN17_METNO|nr:M23 family metallopeptidase [Methylobacterium nodulans]ACL62133.1 Peptidase M23 [Methylobacterium nodulans ORS 2060]